MRRFLRARISPVILSALVGCGPQVTTKPSQRTPDPRPTHVGGQYWTAHFIGDDENGAVMNFLDYGIMPLTLGDKGVATLGYQLGDVKTKWSLKGDVVTIEYGPNPWTLKVKDAGDVLVSDPPVEYGIPGNRVKLLRDVPGQHLNYIGTWRRETQEIRNVPAEIVVRTDSWSAKDPGYKDLPWLTAGGYVVFIGPKDKQKIFEHQSLVLRPSADGKTLEDDLSASTSAYGVQMSVRFRKVE